MGAAQSTSEPNEKIYQYETPISFSQAVVNQLSDRLESPQTSSRRQSTLDDLIRSKIENELEHIKQEEEEVRKQIESALEKENLDHESRLVADAQHDAVQRIPSSAELMADLDDVRNKVDKYQARRDLAEFPQVKSAREDVISCYRYHPSTPLECRKEVNRFKLSVTGAEQQSLKTLEYPSIHP